MPDRKENGAKVIEHTVHDLKILPDPFWSIAAGNKRATVRMNDRNYSVGDRLFLREYEDYVYTGRTCLVLVRHMYHLREFNPANYVVMSFEVLELVTLPRPEAP